MTSAPRGRPDCITWSTRSSTTRSTKRSPASAPKSTSRFTSTTRSASIDNGRGIPTDMHESGKSGGRSRADGAARRRQVRQQRLQGLGRPARRRRVGGQRAVGAARSRDLAQRQHAPAELRARQAARRSHRHRHDEAPRHEGHVQARSADLRDHRLQLRHAGRPPARARVPERRRHRSRWTTSAKPARAIASTTTAASSRSSST